MIVWYNYEEKLRFNCFTGVREITNKLTINSANNSKGPFTIIKDLDKKSIIFYVSKNLVEKLSGVFLVVNNFVVAGNNINDLVIEDAAPEWFKNHPKEFLEPLQDIELVFCFKKLGEKGEFPRRTAYTIDIGNVDYRVNDEAIDWLK